MRRCVAVLAATLAALIGIVAGSIAPPVAIASAEQTETRERSAVEGDFVGRINGLRAGKGLAPLQVHGELTDVARAWATKMAGDDRISHNPNLSKQVQADWQKLGENVGVGMTVASIHDAFVASAGHYRNLVDADFAYVGVGVVYGRDGAIFTTHTFMQLRTAAAPKPAPAPAPAPKPAVAPKPRRAATPAPAPAAAAATPPPSAAVVAVDAPLVEAPRAIVPATPSARLVLVLDQLQALDG